PVAISADPDLPDHRARPVLGLRLPANGRRPPDRCAQPERREAERVRVRLPRLRGPAQPVRRALLPGGNPVHRLRPRGGVPVPLGGLAELHWLARLDHDDGLPRRAGHRPRLRLEEGSSGLGMSTATNMLGVTNPQGTAVTPPDQSFFNDLNSEVSDKG